MGTSIDIQETLKMLRGCPIPLGLIQVLECMEQRIKALEQQVKHLSIEVEILNGKEP